MILWYQCFSEPTHAPPNMNSLLQTAKLRLCISKGSVATVLRWGGQNYRRLRLVSSWCSMPKLLKSANVLWTYSKNKSGFLFGRPYYRSSLWYSVSSVVCRRLSVTFCIVAKRCVLAKNFLKEWIGNQGQRVHFWGRRHFLLPVSPLQPPRWPFLPYFCSYSPAISTRL